MAIHHDKMAVQKPAVVLAQPVKFGVGGRVRRDAARRPFMIQRASGRKPRLWLSTPPASSSRRGEPRELMSPVVHTRTVNLTTFIHGGLSALPAPRHHLWGNNVRD
jgi:hypothetical protein